MTWKGASIKKQPSRIVTMAPTNTQMVAMDNILLLSDFFKILLSGVTGQAKESVCVSCKTGSLHALQ